MNHHRIHVLTRPFTDFPSRRDALCSLAGLGLGFGLLRSPNAAEARKKRKRKRKKDKQVKPNAFGCLSVGKTCKNAEQCCSGICQGKKGQRKCKAHGTGTCDQDGPDLCAPQNPAFVLCNSSDECVCIRTTAGSRFCGDLGFDAGYDCADCQQDADCEALGFPLGSACAPVSEGLCIGACESGMACMVPCGYEPPEL